MNTHANMQYSLQAFSKGKIRRPKTITISLSANNNWIAASNGFKQTLVQKGFQAASFSVQT
jgi:hypothetical protein